ncbi:MAG: hypothetical protein K8R46_09810 [Pirellulales bacterium]|nr:hypothetical protein [Pirellulales bacterium]
MTATPQEIIDAIDDAILTKLQGGAVKSYGIAGRNLVNMDMKELRELRQEYAALLNAANGGRTNYASFNER